MKDENMFGRGLPEDLVAAQQEQLDCGAIQCDFLRTMYKPYEEGETSLNYSKWVPIWLTGATVGFMFGYFLGVR